MEDLILIFKQILLQIFRSFKEERTISAPFHLLRGKRSGQTIQDVGIYHLHNFFGILPKLSRGKYEEELSNLIKEQLLQVSDEGSYKLTNKAIEALQESNFLPFDGWHYRGNEHIFFARLSLVVQTLSHKVAGQMKFMPIQKDEQVQYWVRNFLIANHYQEGNVQERLLKEIIESLENTDIEETAKEIVINRLSGYKTAGLTWQQMSYQQNKHEMDIQLIYISTLHNWLNKILLHKEQYPILNLLAHDLRINIPLSGSAFQTAELFNRGVGIEEISKIRGLKVSTIEDHIVELAMNEPQFSIEQFISREDLEQVLTAVEDYNTRKLKVLHVVVPHLTYFQLRLVLARGEKQ